MIIDVHAHIGRIGTDRTDSLTVPELIENMDRWGIGRAVLLALSDCPEGWYWRSGSEEMLAAAALHPSRLIPFCLIDPRFGDNTPQTDFSALIEDYKERGCKGIGEFIPKLPFDDPRSLNLYRQVGAAGWPVLFDMNNRACYGVTDDPGMPRLEKALRDCPNTVFVGHGPSFWTEMSGDDEHVGYPEGPIMPGGDVPRLMETYPNMWADLSAGSAHNAITRDPEFGIGFLDRFQDKLMFGTDVVRRGQDSPIVHLMEELRQEKKISEAAYRKIARDNAVRLLDLGR